MQAQPDTVVTLAWQLSDAQNEPIAENADGTDFYLGGTDLLPAVARDLLGKEAGARGQLQIEPDEAFGDYDPELLRVELREHFPDVIEPGMQFEQLPAGCAPGAPGVIYTITDIAGDKLVLDGNHALAGMALRVRYTVLEVREPEPDEREARSAQLDDADNGLFMTP